MPFISLKLFYLVEFLSILFKKRIFFYKPSFFGKNIHNHKIMKKIHFKLPPKIIGYAGVGMIVQFLLVGLSLAHPADPLVVERLYGMPLVGVYENARLPEKPSNIKAKKDLVDALIQVTGRVTCLLYTSPSP